MEEHTTPAGYLQARLGSAAGLADVIAAGFDAFELIRLSAEAWQHPGGLAFATWAMTSAEAAAGRDVLAEAPSLPPGGAKPMPPTAGTEDAAAASLSGLAAQMTARLAAATRAADGRDRAACDHAAKLAARITHLLTGPG